MDLSKFALGGAAASESFFKIRTPDLLLASSGGYLALLVCAERNKIHPPPLCLVLAHPFTNTEAKVFTTPPRPVKYLDRLITAEELGNHLDPSGPVLSGSPSPARSGLAAAQNPRGVLYDYAVSSISKP